MEVAKKSQKIPWTLIACLLILVTIFPCVWMVTSSIRPYALIFSPTFEIIPSRPTLEAFRWVVFESDFFLWLRNSLTVSLLTVTWVLILVCPGAYAFSRLRFAKKESVLYGYFVLTQFIGGFGIAGLIGLYTILARLDLLNSLFILSLIYAGGAIPFQTWLLKSYFDGISKEFDEAAIMDGASFIDVLRRVLIPIAKPGIAVVAFFAFMGSWGEFILAATLLNPEHYTLAVGLYGLITRYETPWNNFAAMAVLFALPMIVFFMIAQRYLRAGLTMGGVRG